ncbi:hypothetical protein DPV78_001678 [Talaromyces pinophilus]|nr:hypothetical protein DPV78_001678 [Talaromyces pinophilus]
MSTNTTFPAPSESMGDLIDLLRTDEGFKALCEDDFSLLGADRFERNFRRFFKLYWRDLPHRASNKAEGQVVKFAKRNLRTITGQTQPTSGPFHDVNLQPLPSAHWQPDMSTSGTHNRSKNATYTPLPRTTFENITRGIHNRHPISMVNKYLELCVNTGDHEIRKSLKTHRLGLLKP